jgi:hypothetical protein
MQKLKNKNKINFEKKIKLFKKVCISKKIIVLNFKHELNFPLKFFYFLMIRKRKKKNCIYRPYYPINLKKKKISLFLELKKKGEMSKVFKNIQISSFCRIFKIVKLFEFKKNIKRKVVILLHESNTSFLFQILKYFSNINNRVIFKIIYRFISKEKIQIINNLKKKLCQYQRFKILFILENEHNFPIYKGNLIFKQPILKYIGIPQIGKSILIGETFKFNIYIQKKLNELGFSKKNIYKI